MNLNEQLSNPTIESSLKDWREQGGLTRLEGSRCLNCNELFFPRRTVCPVCHQQKLIPYRFSGKGTIVNIEINNIPQVAIFGYREISPRYLAIIRLDEGVNILGEIIECDKADSLLNKTVHMVIRKQSRSSNTSWKYGYKFKLDNK
ncbi:Zn-ribbon domain-containing OB-fold protein [Limosilactobacillus reuteri]|uniref:2,4-diacetylphloroglucinol biosynthesis protein n=1 Tax=Limosilactobacillus reuteri TaxID=1598 RepID=A0A073JRP2_LIMRT|nr:zinc ribbon domain-containing protein [Limosilactobacillus reuteri]AJO68334.1 RtcPhlb [Limosilactobacillus reuteri]AJO68343.1 RtcPhlb [Limosilactobacillus reuteri]KEK15821.1 2,4-diacetylphloroglucinol biosynthesis protein [Limosilactobacillus reuteri]KEK16438.1 2,4-diacetylphloroglucinol biosynthesis protein [Limosilactobacillus reuteri]KEQ20579.1 2,4-diacetylphloroglucinol biosynthesis protein [Limosilactobacillus reuteri]